MPISVVCPGCSAKLNAPDAAAGKKVKCPKCQGPIVVPAAAAEPDFEVVEDEAPPPAKKPATSEPSKPAVKVKAVAEDDEDEDDRPRAKKAKAKAVEDADDEDEDEEDEKPKKKAKAVRDEEDEDEDEEKPRKKKGDEKSKKKKKKKRDDEGGVSMTRYIISAVLLVILVVVAGAVFYTRWQDNKEIEAENERIRAKNTEGDPSQPITKGANPTLNTNSKQPEPKAKQPDRSDDTMRLEGTWDIEWIEVKGQRHLTKESGEPDKMVVKDGKMTIYKKGEPNPSVTNAPFTLRSGLAFKEMDIKLTSGETVPGIYELTDTDLRIALSGSLGEKQNIFIRPGSFETKGKLAFVLKMKRKT